MARRRHQVPFNLPTVVGRELEYVAQAVEQGHLAGDGLFTERCQSWLADKTGASRVLLTHSGTAALELAALLCDLAPGDEVIMPSFTFASTANAVVLRGARPVFVDIRQDTLNIDVDLIEAAITPRTKAFFPVHYAGVACDMQGISRLADGRGITVVEDAAQALGATLDGRALGTLGQLGCWSFHETKNFISGEGGALALNDERLIGRAEILREKGTNRSQFFRGEVDKYTWVDAGSSYLPSELCAAFLWGQLERWDEVLERRRAIFETYLGELRPLADAGRLALPVVPSGCRHNGHLFYLLLGTEERRDALLRHLDERGINATFHYVPLHESPMGRRLGYRPGQFQVTESTSRRLLRLPCSLGLTDSQQQTVISAVREFFRHSA